MGKSAQTPTPVDYDKLIPLQTAANKDVFSYALGQSRVNTASPYGSTTWSQTPGTLNQGAYESALKEWQANQGGSREWVPGTAGSPGIVGYNTNGPIYGGEDGGSAGYWRTTPGSGGAAPKPEDFMTGGQWTQTQTLSPEQQTLYSSDVANKLGLATTTGSALGRVQEALGQPFDTSGLPAAPGELQAPGAGATPNASIGQYDPGTYITLQNLAKSIADRSGVVGSQLSGLSSQIAGLNPQGYNTEAADALYRQTSRYLDPQVSDQQRMLESRLGEQGFVPGTPAYNNAMDELRRANERNYADARDRALTLGSSVGSRQFGDSLQALQAQISAALSGGQFGLANDQARAGETLNLGQFLLGNQQAQSNEALARAQFGLAGDQARSAEALNLAQFGAGQTQAAFGRQQSAAEFNAAQRQRALLEALQLRQLPLSELNALRTGAQPTVLGGELKQTSVPGLSAVDLLGADAQRYGQELDLYNSKVGSQNALLQVLGQIAGVAIGRP